MLDLALVFVGLWLLVLITHGELRRREHEVARARVSVGERPQRETSTPDLGSSAAPTAVEVAEFVLPRRES